MVKLEGVIFDYGNVISLPQDATCVARMAELLQIGGAAELNPVYQRYRREYDGGLEGSAYWNKVGRDLGRTVSPEQIRQLIELDIQSWIRVNPQTIACLRHLKALGLKLGLLSNMPNEILAYIKQECDWIGYFDTPIFSAPLCLTKPDAPIYHECMRQMALPPERCLFVDDLAENVAAAKACGLNAIQFTGCEQLARELKQYGIEG